MISIYSIANSSSLITSDSNATIAEPVLETSQRWRLAQKNQGNLLQEFQECLDEKDYSTIGLVCSGYG